MNNQSAFDIQPSDPTEPGLSLGTRVLRNAILAGADNVVHLLLIVSVSAADKPDGGSTNPDADQWPAFHDLVLHLTVPRGVTFEFHRDMAQARGDWTPPDLAAGSEVIGLARIILPAGAVPSVGEGVRIAAVRLRGTPLNDHVMVMTGTTIVLPVLSAEDYAAVPEDDVVRELIDETDGNNDAWWKSS